MASHGPPQYTSSHSFTPDTKREFKKPKRRETSDKGRVGSIVGTNPIRTLSWQAVSAESWEEEKSSDARVNVKLLTRSRGTSGWELLEELHGHL